MHENEIVWNLNKKKKNFKVDVGGSKQNLQQQGYWQIDEQIERINQQNILLIKTVEPSTKYLKH